MSGEIGTTAQFLGQAVLSVTPFLLGAATGGAGVALIQGIAGNALTDLIGGIGRHASKRLLHRLGEPNNDLNKALAAALDDTLREKRDDDELRADLPDAFFTLDRDCDTFRGLLRQLRRDLPDIGSGQAGTPVLLAYLEQPDAETFRALAEDSGTRFLPTWPAEVSQHIFAYLQRRVTPRFWYHVKHSPPAWHAYATEVFFQMRVKAEEQSEKLDNVQRTLAALAVRETETLRTAHPSPDLVRTIERVESLAEQVFATTRRIEHKVDILMVTISEEFAEMKRAMLQQGRDPCDLSQDELENLLAERRGLTLEQLRVLLGEAHESDDPATRGAALLVERRPDDALKEVADIEATYIAGLSVRAQAYADKFQFDKALAEREKIATLLDFDADPLAWAEARFKIAYVLEDLARYREIEPILREVLTLWSEVLGLGHPDTLGCRNNLANALMCQGKFAESETEHRIVLASRERELGAEHPETLVSRGNVANVLYNQGHYADAVAEYRVVHADLVRVLGDEHPTTIKFLNNLAQALLAQGKFAEAEAEHRVVLTLRERMLGAEHPDTLESRNNLANALEGQGKHAEAEAEHRTVLAARERVLGADNPQTLGSRNNLANALRTQGKLIEAEIEHRAVLAARERLLGAEHLDTIDSRSNLAILLADQGKHAESEAEARAVLAARERVLDAEHPDTLGSRMIWVICLVNGERWQEALKETEAAYMRFQKVLGDEHPFTETAKKLLEELTSDE